MSSAPILYNTDNMSSTPILLSYTAQMIDYRLTVLEFNITNVT
jgi:hypothetical protein